MILSKKYTSKIEKNYVFFKVTFINKIKNQSNFGDGKISFHIWTKKNELGKVVEL